VTAGGPGLFAGGLVRLLIAGGRVGLGPGTLLPAGLF
jgi:hypothetical protein